MFSYLQMTLDKHFSPKKIIALLSYRLIRRTTSDRGIP